MKNNNWFALKLNGKICSIPLTCLTILLFNIYLFAGARVLTFRSDLLRDHGANFSLAPATAAPNVTVVPFGGPLVFPRGLKFGPDGYLYVAQAGMGSTSTVGLCDQVPNIGPWFGGNEGRVSKLDSQGNITLVAAGFPSTFSPVGGQMGVSDIEFFNGDLYALIGGGGCSHGHPNPADDNAVARINADGTHTMFANISNFVKTHETAKFEEEDFEPDGTPYSMVAAKGYLFVVEPNHGQIIQIDSAGNMSRLVDVSATYGHVVPTAMTYHGNLYVGNLSTFPVHVGAAQIMKVTPSGNIKTMVSGLTAVLGVQFGPDGYLYALEMSTVDNDFPVPGSGQVVRVLDDGCLQPVVTGLAFPTAMTFGPDGKLYISNWGFGPPLGQILQVTLQ